LRRVADVRDALRAAWYPMPPYRPSASPGQARREEVKEVRIAAMPTIFGGSTPQRVRV
jgi:hypothetical protein